MGLDIRVPIGLMFTVFGVLLVGFGVLSDKALYQRSLGININVGWGIVLLAFGGLMLLLGLRKQKAQSSPDKAAMRSHA